MKSLFFLLLLCVALFGNWKSQRENLEYVYVVGDFRIFYSLQGNDAIADKSDVNKNSIPDFVENLGMQLDAANRVLNKTLGFKNPLNNSVYKGRAKYIDLHVLKLKEGNNGLAGDAVIQYNYKAIDSDGKSVSMAVSNKLKVGNLTPLHELFHIYQNGYTMIKNSWYTEGTARWSEMIFTEGFGKTRPLPRTTKELQKVMSQTYGAKYFWNRIAYLCSSKKRFDTKEFKDLKYIGTNRSVINGNDIHGFEFMARFLENLDYIDDTIAKRRNFEKYNWKEKFQKDSFNDRYILQALLKTIKESNSTCRDNAEIKKFVKVANSYIVGR